jgi:hypothetical protein
MLDAQPMIALDQRHVGLEGGALTIVPLLD